MKWPLFENKVKGELSAHSSEVDVDALWSAIEPEVNAINQSKRKKRRGAFWWFFAGLLVVGSAAGFYFLIFSDENTQVIAENDFNKNSTKQVIEKNNAEVESGELIDADTGVQKDKNKEGIYFDEKNKNEGTNGLKINEGKNDAGKLIEKNNAPLKKEKLIFAKRENRTNTKKEEIIFDKKIIKTELKEGEKAQSSGNDLSEKENKEKIKSGDLINKAAEKDGAGLIINEQPEKEEVVENSNAPASALVQETPDKENISSAKETGEKDEVAVDGKASSENEDGGVPTPPVRSKSFHFSLGINGGLGYADRSLEAKSTAGEELFGFRERYEKQLETSHLGLQLTAEHVSGISFTGGLQYTRMVELYERNNVETVTDSVWGVAYYAVLPNNDTVAVEGDVPHTTIYTLEKKIYNRYTMIDVPLLLGYRYLAGDWAFGAQAGVFANLSMKAEGRVLKNELAEEELSEIIKSNIGLSYFGSLSVGYRINDNLEIGISPFARFFPKSIAENNYGLSQKYLLVGLDARFRYWF